jgi:DNA polymerase
MDESNQNSPQLVDEIISFIKKEREMYGDFAIREFSDLPLSKPETQITGSDKVSEPAGEVYDENLVYEEIEKCTSLEELEALCEKAEELKTDLENTKLVFGGGNPNADLMLIGEAPGAEEDKQGEPFVGSAGKMLTNILEAINFKRDDVFIANILKHRPPDNRDPLPEERERSLPFLIKQIELVNPKLILALGKVAAQTLLESDASLTKMRGKFHIFRGKYELLATFHPAALLYQQKWKRPTWEDVQLLRKRYDELGGRR